MSRSIAGYSLNIHSLHISDNKTVELTSTVTPRPTLRTSRHNYTIQNTKTVELTSNVNRTPCSELWGITAPYKNTCFDFLL